MINSCCLHHPAIADIHRHLLFNNGGPNSLFCKFNWTPPISNVPQPADLDFMLTYKISTVTLSSLVVGVM